MATTPIPSVGLTAFRLLTEARDQKQAALDAWYQRECETLGDEILAVLGHDPKNPTLTVCYGDGVITGFPDPNGDAIIQQTVAKLQAQREAEAAAAEVVVAPTPEPVPEPAPEPAPVAIESPVAA